MSDAFNSTTSDLSEYFATLESIYLKLLPIQTSLGLSSSQNRVEQSNYNDQRSICVQFCNENELDTCKENNLSPNIISLLLFKVRELMEDEGLQVVHREMEVRVANSGNILSKNDDPSISSYYSCYHSLMGELNCLENYLSEIQ